MSGPSIYSGETSSDWLNDGTEITPRLLAILFSFPDLPFTLLFLGLTSMDYVNRILYSLTSCLVCPMGETCGRLEDGRKEKWEYLLPQLPLHWGHRLGPFYKTLFYNSSSFHIPISIPSPCPFKPGVPMPPNRCDLWGASSSLTGFSWPFLHLYKVFFLFIPFECALS